MRVGFATSDAHPPCAGAPTVVLSGLSDGIRVLQPKVVKQTDGLGLRLGPASRATQQMETRLS